MSLEARLENFAQDNPELEEMDENYPDWARQIGTLLVDAIKSQTSEYIELPSGEPEDDLSLPLGGTDNLYQLQRYAAHLHYTGKPPEEPEASGDPNEYDEYVLRYYEAAEEGGIEFRTMKYIHTVMSSDMVYYLPVDFPEPILIEDDDEDEEMDMLTFCSSHRLLAELEELNEHLLIVGDYGSLGEEEAWKHYDNEGDPWRFVRWCWIVLHWLARESIKRKVSIHLS